MSAGDVPEPSTSKRESDGHLVGCPRTICECPPDPPPPPAWAMACPYCKGYPGYPYCTCAPEQPDA